jgi:putative transposase
MVLFFIELATRRVEIAGIASTANGLWMSQIGRNLTDAVDGILNGKRYLIHDRDPLFTPEFLNMLAETGVKSVRLPPRSPNLKCVRREIRADHQGILSGPDDSIRRGIVADSHFQFRRPLSHRAQSPGAGQPADHPEAGHLGKAGMVQRRGRLGGMLNYYYYRSAA